MAKMVYDESYGELTFALRAAIRKFNVSPSDYRDLEEVYGEGNYADITKAIKDASPDGMYEGWETLKQARSLENTW